MTELRKVSDLQIEIDEEYLKIDHLRRERDLKELDIEKRSARVAMLIEQRTRLQNLEKKIAEDPIEGK